MTPNSLVAVVSRILQQDEYSRKLGGEEKTGFSEFISLRQALFRCVYGHGRGSVRSMRGLGPTMNAQGQSIGISIGMLPQTLIMSRLDQLSRLGARI